MIEEAMPRTAASLPYAWPYHGRFDPRATAILVCSGDRGCDPDGEAVRRLARLAGIARQCGVVVIAMPAVGTSPPAILAGDVDATVPRPVFGGFTGTDLSLVLRDLGRSDLIIAGFPLELGADCTMREANDLGFECLLVTDCCSSLARDTFAGAVSSVQMSGGIFGAVASAADVLDVLRVVTGGISHALTDQV